MPKLANRAAASLALALSLSLCAAAHAQEQDLSPVAITLGQNLGLGKAGGQAAPASALRFVRQAAVARQVNQRLAKNLAQTMGQPGKAKSLQTLLDGGALQAAMGESIAQLGWRQDDLADVLSAAVLMGWQATHGQAAPRGANEAVRRGMQGSLLHSGWLAKLDDAAKQTLADTVGTGLMLLLANLENAQPAGRDEARQAVRGMLRTTLGLDVAQLALTPQGLVPASGAAAAQGTTRPGTAAKPAVQPAADKPAPEAAPEKAAPGKTAPAAQPSTAHALPVERVLRMKEEAIGYGGYVMTVYNPYLLFDNGTVISKPKAAPEDLDHQQRDRRQGRWGKWDSSWGKLRIVWDGSAQGTKPTEKPASAPECLPAGRNDELKGHWEAVGGGGSIAVGGDVGVLNTSNFYFDEDGRFSNQRLTAINSPTTAGHARRGNVGRYRLSGYTLHLQFEVGSERRLFFCTMDKGRKALQIGASTYVRQ